MKTITTRTANSKLAKKKRKKIIVIIILSSLLITILLLLYANNSAFNNVSNSPKATPAYLEEQGNAIEGTAVTKSRVEILEELKKQQLVVTDKLSSNITFSSGKAGTIGEWIAENPADNNIIQQAEVYFDELLIAKSTPIYPNQHIEAIELNQNIKSGEYDVIAYINYYDIETKEFISKAGYKIHLTVR